jgi:undecaprenyl-diphosphatase
MNVLQSLVLSFVEGVTEFLPVSSTGHMILASKLMGIIQTDFVKSFEIIIQFGAILAVMLFFFHKIRKISEVWPKLLVAFLPAAGIGFVSYKLIKNVLLGNSFVTVISLVVGGIILIGFEKIMGNRKSTTDFHTMSYAQALIIGIFQSISVIPGVSRAAATIVGGMFQGLSREDAVEFSFLLAIPTMAAASGYDLLKSSLHWNGSEMMILGVGFIGSFVSALITVKWFIGFVKKNTFIPFAYYRIIAGILFWLIVLR